MVRCHALFSERHAPFDKKNMAPCIADVPFFISSNDPQDRLVKGRQLLANGLECKIAENVSDGYNIW